MMAGVGQFVELMDRMATAAERQADAAVATNTQILLALEHLKLVAKHVKDIRDVYGVLLTHKTAAVPPWHYTDQGHNIVAVGSAQDKQPHVVATEAPPVEHRCQARHQGDRCKLPAGHQGAHLLEADRRGKPTVFTTAMADIPPEARQHDGPGGNAPGGGPLP